jgi:hypothetical protein
MPVESRRAKPMNKLRGDIQESGWETARPGQPAKPQAAAKGETDWKLATQPIPEAAPTPIVESTPVRDYLPRTENDDPYGTSASPEWSPERANDGEAGVETPSEPAWSPTR